MSLIERFENPSSAERGKPFWAWNGALEKEELLHQIDVFHQMGFGGYFCHSRVGLKTEYLGEEWFELINACADRGSELGMETWLYDEDRWPSGCAGGLLTENKEYAMKFIRMNQVSAADFQWNNEILAAFCVELEGHTFWNKRRLQPGESPSDGVVLFFSIELMADDGYCNGHPYVDTMSRKATQRFIEMTHEQYKKHCGQRLGNVIKGIFTDEPHRGAVMCGTSLNNPNAEFLTPYTEALFPYIRERFGVELEDFLPELFLCKKGEDISRIKWIYMEALTSLFCENFLRQIYEWCEENHMLFTGHLLHEDTLTAQASMMGSLMRGYAFFHYPGIDILGGKNQAYWVVKQLTSVARQLGKQKILSELYGCTGWHMNFQQYKEVGDWQALMGINLRCQHLSWYTMEGENKRDYPASISLQSAWYRDYEYLETYFSRLHVFLEGDDACDVLVINPIESIWCEIEPGWSYFLEATGERAKQTERKYRDFFYLLYHQHIPFDYADEALLLQHGAVEKAKDGVFLRLGRCYYQTVLIHGLLTIRQSTLDLLREFVLSGGNVIFVDEYPSFIDAQHEFSLPAAFRHCTSEQLSEILHANIPAEITDNLTEKIAEQIFVTVKRVFKNQTRFMLLNMDTSASTRQYTVSLPYIGRVERWDPRTGRREDVLSFFENGRTVFTVSLCGGQEALFLIDSAVPAIPADQIEKKDRVRRIIPIKDAYRYRLEEKNILPLDMVICQIDDEPPFGPIEILKADRKIRRHWGLAYRGGEQLQPWYVRGRKEPVIGKLRLIYSFSVKDLPRECALIIERSERYQISINQQPYQKDTTEKWMDRCFDILPLDIHMLRTGKNIIELTADFRESLGIESIYLYGDFGVELCGLQSALIALPSMLKIDDLTKQGLPFYGAGITYQIEQLPKISDGERLVVRFDAAEAAYLRLTGQHVNRVMAFAPFECDITDWIKDGLSALDITVMLNRRNTFGPLHLIPDRPSAIGPEHFLTEGDGFKSDGYSLIPQGSIDGLCFVIES